MKRRTFWLIGVFVIGIGLGLVGGVILDRQVLTAFVPLENIPANATSDFKLMAEAWNTIKRFYVDRPAVKPLPLTFGAISGMVDALGDTGHSRFMTPEMVKIERNFAVGHFVGIGVEVQLKGGHVVIVAPLDGSPAQQAGLRAGDMILKVNGQDVTGLPLDQVVERISGKAGTSVSLTVLRPGTSQMQNVTLVRASITIHNVTWQHLPETAIAQVRIAAFSEGVTKDLKEALKSIKEKRLKGIILDLRNNPGGLLAEAVGVASQFLRGGNALLEKNAKGKITPVPVKPDGIAPDIPMVVLINGGTASAAEIVSGALKDAQRAILIGETTFGTGTVLSQFFLSDGSALLLAVEEWLTPDGQVIWHKGITPNQIVRLPPDVMPLFPEAEKGMTPAQLRARKDEQLLRALDLLIQPARKQALWHKKCR
jgi:carboxyl-terminal processing protease